MVRTNYGWIEGIDRGTYREYRGIPYAKPPVGTLRWKAPEAPEPWDGVYEAEDFKNMCMQHFHNAPPFDRDFYCDPSFARPMSEDCLYLHIWAPKLTGDKPLPVAVWYHGGAFLGGWSSEMEFDGAGYCKRGVILVSVEYRCNVFGFLAHPWLSAENERGVSGNYGTLDQIAALKWVHENISAFGGDPKRITIFGQSAGAMSVQTLASSPLTEGMIAGAIMQSGGSYGSGLHLDLPLSQAERYGARYAALLDVHTPEELRGKSSEELMTVLNEFNRETAADGSFKLIPNIDGYVLPDGYYTLIEQGKIRNIPYILGSTRDDIMVTPENREIGSPLYHGINAFGQLQARLGKAPCWLYYFTRALPGDGFGAWHSCELWYSFDTMERCWRPWEERDFALRDRIMAYWTNFMKTGDPNGVRLPEWAPARTDAPNLLELN